MLSAFITPPSFNHARPVASIRCRGTDPACIVENRQIPSKCEQENIFTITTRLGELSWTQFILVILTPSTNLITGWQLQRCKVCADGNISDILQLLLRQICTLNDTLRRWTRTSRYEKLTRSPLLAVGYRPADARCICINNPNESRA